MKDHHEAVQTARRVALCFREAGLRAAIASVLERGGCAIADCDGADIGVDDVTAAAPDLIVIEAQSRDASGFELCQSVCAAGPLADAKVLMLIDSGRSIVRRRAEALGANAVMSLPVRMDALQAEVDRLLDLH